MGQGKYLLSSVYLLCLPILQLKSEFLAVKRLRELSGWSWDDVQKMVHTTDEIWANHIAVCAFKYFFGCASYISF